MKRFFIIYFLFVLISITGAQNNNSDETVTRRVADFILEHAEFKFQGIANKQTYNSTNDIPEGLLVTDRIIVSHLGSYGLWKNWMIVVQWERV